MTCINTNIKYAVLDLGNLTPGVNKKQHSYIGCRTKHVHDFIFIFYKLKSAFILTAREVSISTYPCHHRSSTGNIIKK